MIEWGRRQLRNTFSGELNVPREEDDTFELTPVEAWAKVIQPIAFAGWALFVVSFGVVGWPVYPLGAASFVLFGASILVLNRAVARWRYGRKIRLLQTSGFGNKALREFNRRFTYRRAWQTIRDRRNPPGPISR